MALLDPVYLDVVVELGKKTNFGEERKASGFLISRPANPEKTAIFIYLISNKHVFEGLGETAVMRLNKKDGTSKIYEIILKVGNDINRVGHHDQGIDVAGICIYGDILDKDGVDLKHFDIENVGVTSTKMEEMGMTEGDFIYTLGINSFLEGFGKEEKYPLCRQGIISRVRDLYLKKNNNFIIDCLCYPGNSGGPVITKPEIATLDGTKSIDRSYLIGIVSKYINYQEDLINSQDRQVKIKIEQNSGLTIVYPVEYILDVINSFNEGN